MRGRLSLLFVLLGTLLPGWHAARGADAPVVALIDSGIEASHPQFAPNQVVAWKDWVADKDDPYDDNGHGTAVASRAAGLTMGAYPGAKLAVAKVLNKENKGRAADVDEAIRWAADQGAAAINVSIWSASPSPLGMRTIAEAVHYARTKGSLVVWIAGNGGEVVVEDRRIPYPLPATTMWGASSPEALVVGSVAPDGQVDGYSQWVPEVVARGSGVEIAWLGGLTARGWGTSFAAPWVAGAAARLVAEGAPRNADWLKWVINHSAVDNPSTSYAREGYGWFKDTSLNAALKVARGAAAVPPRDGRDTEHDAAMTVGWLGTGQEPAGTTRP